MNVFFSNCRSFTIDWRFLTVAGAFSGSHKPWRRIIDKI
jgi:hypothetical protein